MNIMTLVLVLAKMRWLTPKGLFLLLAAVRKEGVNVMLLLHVAARLFGDKPALTDDWETVDYRQLFTRSRTLSIHFSHVYKMKKGQKIGFLCRNHLSFVTALFAASRIGADLYLLNPDAGKNRLKEMMQHHAFDVLVHDEEFAPLLNAFSISACKKFIRSSTLQNAIADENGILPRSSSGRIVLLTGGTTGKPKEAVHRPSILAYISPFFTLVQRLELHHRQTAFVATPLFHGYGIGMLLSMIALGKKVVISSDFKADKACTIIKKQRIDVVSVVPLMVHKMLDCRVQDLQSLVCIASGGAELNPKLVQSVSDQLGMILYNLYGTSEGGLLSIATPQELATFPGTAGRKIRGIQLTACNEKGQQLKPGEIGQLCVKSKNGWAQTGDVGWQDGAGYYYLCGRTDDMIVSAGENVYPQDIERVLSYHPGIDAAAVIGIRDERFGQRLAAFVQPAPHLSLTTEELLSWLRPQLARFQLPKEIIFVQTMPHTALGKLDKKELEKHFSSTGEQQLPLT
ncbi:AMP-binding protein [Domibacillus enclensis]|uniref:Acyl-CoA synthetase (AMP-forming)/AMP-acid ligase II n=1 Tax=Domibacillus enclensis TaxID=1017273 RepID=A0A1N6Y3H2_9BACI|nr:AMP-binding protein [Domibacillus enclensis]OXS77501.1 hypothetical protein B1B05_11740 [Domibacillus enclensis]SIR09084.1 Acyl-CoA synthetase (AMP-forming)/AMP-acid ligase II [Domibacillus enclensis]